MPGKMHTKMIAILMKIAIIMLVLGMFATSVAYAETSGEQYQTLKDQLIEAQESFQDSQEKFQDAKDRFESERSLQNTEELKEALRNFLNHTIEYTIKRLETLQIQAEGPEENGLAPFIISDNIDDYIGQLEDMRDDVAAAETEEDFNAVIKEIRDTWQHVDLESRYFIEGTLNNKVDVFNNRSDSIAIRIQAEIDRLDEVGEDTKDLKKLLDDYEKALNASHDDATELFDNHNGFNDEGELQNAEEARAFLADAAAKMRSSYNMRETNSLLRQIFEELKEHRPGSVSLSSTGALAAQGNGKATISGNLDIKVNGKDGILIIKDYDEDAVIEIEGKGIKEMLDDGTIKYEGFDGSATIKGSSITVVITGDNIELNAEGTGSAVLRGHGSYNANGNQNMWAEQVRARIRAQVQNQFSEEHRVQQQNNSESGNQTKTQNQTHTPKSDKQNQMNNQHRGK